MLHRSEPVRFECLACGHVGGPKDGIQGWYDGGTFVACDRCMARHTVVVEQVAGKRSFKIKSLFAEDGFGPLF